MGRKRPTNSIADPSQSQGDPEVAAQQDRAPVRAQFECGLATRAGLVNESSDHRLEADYSTDYSKSLSPKLICRPTS